MIGRKRTIIENEIAGLKEELAKTKQLGRRLQKNAESANPETAAMAKNDLKKVVQLHRRLKEQLVKREEEMATIPKPKILTNAHREALERDGYVVIPNVIPKRLADDTLSEFQAFNAHATGQLFSDEDYKRDRELRNIHGIIEYPGGLSHVDFVNRIREHPNVQQVFADIYEVDPSRDPIVCGMDRVNYQGSTNMRGIDARSRNAWWHVDQNWNHPEFQCIQGYVDMVGSETKKHAGLQVISNSHLRFPDLAHAHAAGVTDGGWDRDWHRMSEEELEYCMMKGGKKVNVKCPQGGMVLWDSRTIHMSRPNRHPDDERFVVYTCGWPRSRLSQLDFARREEAKRRRRATSHWPDARHMFPEKPNWFGNHSEEPQAVVEAWINRPKAIEYKPNTKRSRSRSRTPPKSIRPSGPQNNQNNPIAPRSRTPPRYIAPRSRSRGRTPPLYSRPIGPQNKPISPRSRSRSRTPPKSSRPNGPPAPRARTPPMYNQPIQEYRASLRRSKTPPPPKKKTIQLSADEMRRIRATSSSSRRRMPATTSSRPSIPATSASRPRIPATSSTSVPIDVALLTLTELRHLAGMLRGTKYHHLSVEPITSTNAIFVQYALSELFPGHYALKKLYKH